MKIIVLLTYVFFSFFIVAQNKKDSTRTTKEHCIGFEIGNRLAYYNLYYEYCMKFKKNTFTLQFGGNLNPFYDLNDDFGIGNMVSFNYYHGENLCLTFSLTQSLLTNLSVVKGKYENKSWLETPIKTINETSFTIGVLKKHNNFSYYINLGVGYLFYKQHLQNNNFINLTDIIPVGNIGLKYTL